MRSDRGLDPRIDRRHLTTVSYASGGLLADRQQLYRFAVPGGEPLTDWLFAVAGGARSLREPIVDVGAGNGQYLAALPGRRAVALDLSRGMLQGPSWEGIACPRLEADVQALPLATGAAGTVLANHMLYHVPDMALAARELRRALRAGGVLLAVTNGRDHLAELGRLMDESIGEVGGASFHMDRSGERFTLDDGAEVLTKAFGSVRCHHRRAQLVVPEVAPVMRYLA
ncbi:MAG TPA: class I SAM-dependent methyltransferase, partial [Acidimicrobiales bacterium]|nr:class I SAM-dependent methyltransferase [Acidimicrobiales bacterium]